MTHRMKYLGWRYLKPLGERARVKKGNLIVWRGSSEGMVRGEVTIYAGDGILVDGDGRWYGPWFLRCGHSARLPKRFDRALLVPVDVEESL
jgi:hypothetical protein